uniref:Auxin transporter-like protein 2 n=1 Tax=Cajanus cajan TaxID=3821 RepID=A0A151QY23_CAJCA|nr:Auxin transporter-like protein 2 [Cajanus cajan]
METVLPQKQAEEAIVASLNETKSEVGVREEAEKKLQEHSSFSFKSLLCHGGSIWDAWFSCAVAQVLLTLPCSFAQLAMLSGVSLQIFYGILGSWTTYLISVLYMEYRSRKEKENVNFKNHVIQWFEVLDGLLGLYWKAAGLTFNCTFLLFESVIQLIGCARLDPFLISTKKKGLILYGFVLITQQNTFNTLFWFLLQKQQHILQVSIK